MKPTTTIQELLHLNETELAAKTSAKRLVAGYDGFVDTTVRPVSQAASAGSPAKVFETIREFGEYLTSKAGQSCSVELLVESKHLGGNMPFFTSGAEHLGLSVTGIGMLGGSHTVAEPFRALAGPLYPFAPPGESLCMEFRDGKVLLAPSVSLDKDGWELAMATTNNQAPFLMANADLAALVNWSELSFADRLWQDTYRHVFQDAVPDWGKYVLFDLCDISRKSTEEIDGVLALIGRFSTTRTSVLSMNKNEALTVSERLLGGIATFPEIGRRAMERYGICEVLVHTAKRSYLMDSQGTYEQTSDYVPAPAISTGAGDHFNAASAFAAVMGLAGVERLLFAARAAALYVANGHSPSLGQILRSFQSLPEAITTPPK